MIKLPHTDGAGNHNFDVHVYPKNVSNTDLALKDVAGDQKPVSKNENLVFEMKAKFRNNVAGVNQVNSVDDLRAGTAGSYTYGTASITDTLNPYFVLKDNNLDNIKVYWLDMSSNFETTELLRGTDYTVTGTAPTYVIALTPVGIDKAIALGNKTGFGVKLEATYVGFPSGNTGAPTTLTNKMTADMKPADFDPDEPYTPEEDDVYVPSISIIVNKTKQADGTPLAGVEFALATRANPTDDSHFVQGASGILKATSGSDGVLRFSNLDGYTDADGAEFWLVETKTVAGYQLKVVPIKVTFKNKAGYLADTDVRNVYFDADGKWLEDTKVITTADVTNALLTETDEDEPGFSLPLTGGAGTIMFTAIGMVVMLGAAVLYLKTKKKNIQE